MPIRINLKEIFPSDSQDITVDKLNFNFNKLLALGVGDQGDPGSTGPQGAAGPVGLSGIQGLRGSTWFVDAGDPNTLTFTGLIDQDLYLDTIAFSVWQYDEMTGLWTQVLNFSSIINYYISLSPSPFNRGFGIGSPQDDRFITFNRRGNDYVNSQIDVTRGAFNTANSDILLLTNFNESTISNAIGFPNFPALPGDMFDALLKVYVNHSEGVSEVSGRYHLEMGSLYLDHSIPAEPTLSLLKHNLKSKFKKNDVSLTTTLTNTNTWINIAQFSLSVPEPEPIIGIDQNGMFEFVTPKWNNEGMSSIQNEIKFRVGPAEALTEYSGLNITDIGDGITISDITSLFSAGIMKGLSTNFQVPYTNDDFFLINVDSLDGIFINTKVVQTNGTLDVIHTSNARFVSKIGTGLAYDGNPNKDLSSVFSNGNIIVSTWAGALAATNPSQDATKNGIMRINQLDSTLTQLEYFTNNSVYNNLFVPPGTDNHGHQDWGIYSKFPTTNLTHVDFVGKYLFATRIRPQNYIGSFPNISNYNTLIVAELDSNGSSIRPIGYWGTSATQYYAKKVQVVGSTAYVLTKKASTSDWTDTSSYLHAVDVSDPTAPTTLSSETTTPDDNYLDFVTLNERAFISAYDDAATAIKIIKMDISDPSNITAGSNTTVVASGATEKPAPIKIDGTTVYLGYGSKIYAYAAKNSNSTVLTSLISGGFEIDPNLRISDIIINGQYLYVLGENSSNSYGELYTLDLSTVSSPVVVGYDTRSTLTAPGKMTLVGNKIYATSSQGVGGLSATDGGLSIFEIDGITAPAADLSTIKANEIKISNNLYVGEKLDVGHSANIGAGGLFIDRGVGLDVDGPIKVNGNTFFTGITRVRTTNSANQTITSNLLGSTTADFNVLSYDSLGEFDLVNNRFTAKYDGYYCFEFRGVLLNNTTSHIFASTGSQLRDSNSNFYTIRATIQAAVVDGLSDEFVKQGNSYDVGGSKTIYLTAGQWADVRISSYAQDFSNAAINLSLTQSELIINRIG